ncbi:MAG: hypothetical protein ACI4NE_03985 [Succinivibrio sp.]
MNTLLNKNVNSPNESSSIAYTGDRLSFEQKEKQRKHDLACQVIFNLLFRTVSRSLTHFLDLATVLEGDIFGSRAIRKRCRNVSDFVGMYESPFNMICRLARVKDSVFLNDIKKAATSMTSLAKTVINCKSPSILNCLGSLLTLYKGQFSLKLDVDDMHKQTYMSWLLSKVGASKNLNCRITGLHYKTISKIYNFNSLIKDSSARTGASAPIRLRDPAKIIHKIISNADNYLFIMLMLALYTLCVGVITGDVQSDNHFQQKIVPKKISYTLAAGVYATTLLLANRIKTMPELFPNKCCSMPTFDEFHQILEIYVSGEGEAAACMKCHTPGLEIRLKEMGGEYLNDIPCPCCSNSNEYYYSLNDSYKK